MSNMVSFQHGRAPQFRPSKGCVGIASAFELAIRFTEWAKQQHKVTHLSIMRDWGVSRATAYRWLRSYHAAYGMTHNDTRDER